MQKFTRERLRHSLLLIYPIIYLCCFFVLEKNVRPAHIIEIPLDHKIPFCEYFIIPYYLWFLYVAATVAFFYFFLDLGDFYRLCMHLFLGMTIFLFVSWIYPNGLDLRPDQFPRDNVFTDMVKALYRTDTSTNVFPSIHVYNSICIHLAIAKNDYLGKKIWVNICSFTLMLLIILSTMFLKQHSVLDVISGIVLAGICFPLFYKMNWIPFRSRYPLNRKAN